VLHAVDLIELEPLSGAGQAERAIVGDLRCLGEDSVAIASASSSGNRIGGGPPVQARPEQ
jgi:hypothetical protein